MKRSNCKGQTHKLFMASLEKDLPELLKRRMDEEAERNDWVSKLDDYDRLTWRYEPDRNDPFPEIIVELPNRYPVVFGGPDGDEHISANVADLVGEIAMIAGADLAVYNIDSEYGKLRLILKYEVRQSYGFGWKALKPVLHIHCHWEEKEIKA